MENFTSEAKAASRLHVQPTKRGVALVIGNSVYQWQRSLPNAANDANDMAKALRQIGFDVLHETNLTRYSFWEAIKAFLNSPGAVTVGLLFYSGHAIQIGSNAYFLPTDVREAITDEVDIETDAICLTTIQTLLAHKTSTTLIFLDACRSDPLKDNESFSRRLSGLEPRKNSFIAYSTGVGEKAFDGRSEDGHSPFTAALLEELNNEGISISDIMARVNGKVKKNTENRQQAVAVSRLEAPYLFRPAAPPSVPSTSAANTGTASSQIAPTRIQFTTAIIASNVPSREFTVGHGKTEWFRDDENSPDMILVPAGSCQRAARKASRLDKPSQSAEPEIAISYPFAVSRYPVTLEQYKIFVSSTNHEMPDSLWTYEGAFWATWKERAGRYYLNPGFDQTPQHPVVGINLADARAYAAWLRELTGQSYRLLTRNEWWYAIGRWEERPAFGIHESLEVDELVGTVPANSIEAGPWGIFRQNGRVWEWCDDCCVSRNVGNATHFHSFERGIEKLRHLEGGTLTLCPDGLAAACKAWGHSLYRASIFGIRVAREVIE